MKTINIILLSILILTFSSCKTQKLIVDKDFQFIKNDIDYKIIDLSINKNILTVKISYKSSEKDNFSLIFNKSYLKSFPPQAILFLKHESTGNKSNKEITKELKFDISDVAYPKSKKVYIKLFSNNKKVTYEYK